MQFQLQEQVFILLFIYIYMYRNLNSNNWILQIKSRDLLRRKNLKNIKNNLKEEDLINLKILGRNLIQENIYNLLHLLIRKRILIIKIEERSKAVKKI